MEAIELFKSKIYKEIIYLDGYYLFDCEITTLCCSYFILIHNSNFNFNSVLPIKILSFQIK
jgi:hypothetical protein